MDDTRITQDLEFMTLGFGNAVELEMEHEMAFCAFLKGLGNGWTLC